MEKRWLSKEEEKIVRKEIRGEIPSLIIPCILIVGILGVGVYLDPKVCGIASILFLPVAGVLFWLTMRDLRDLKRITEKRYMIKEFEVLETRTSIGSGTTQRVATLRDVNTEKVENVSSPGRFYVFENNKFVSGIEIEGRKKRIYFEGR